MRESDRPLERMRANWTRSATRVVFAAVAVASFPQRVPAEPPAVVVVSEGAPVFRQALVGVQRVLGQDVSVFDLASASPDEVAGRVASAHPRAIIAIGPSATKVAERVDGRTPVIAVLAPNAAPSASVGQRPLYVVALFAPWEPLLNELAALLPRARTLWTIYSSGTSRMAVERLRAAAERTGYRLVATEVPDAGGAARALQSPPEDVGAFLLLPDPVVRNAAFDQAVLRLSFERRFPVVGASRADVRSGALFALQLDPDALGAQAADIARTVLRSATPPAPGVVAPAGYVLVLNAATAHNLGLEIPDAVRKHAAEVLGQ
jgi:putative ABC transport system substrate-binding protein